jgi:hypothetical protein
VKKCFHTPPDASATLANNHQLDMSRRYEMTAEWKRLIAPGLIDSALKLRVLLLFSTRPRLSSGIRHLSEWLCECPWAIEEALDGLVEAGFLAHIDDPGGSHYRLEPRLEHKTPLNQLLSSYDHPLQRDEIYALVRVANEEQRFRDWLAEVQADAEPEILIVCARREMSRPGTRGTIRCWRKT